MQYAVSGTVYTVVSLWDNLQCGREMNARCVPGMVYTVECIGNNVGCRGLPW